MPQACVESCACEQSTSLYGDFPKGLPATLVPQLGEDILRLPATKFRARFQASAGWSPHRHSRSDLLLVRGSHRVRRKYLARSRPEKDLMRAISRATYPLFLHRTSISDLHGLTESLEPSGPKSRLEPGGYVQPSAKMSHGSAIYAKSIFSSCERQSHFCKIKSISFAYLG